MIFTVISDISVLFNKKSCANTVLSHLFCFRYVGDGGTCVPWMMFGLSSV